MSTEPRHLIIGIVLAPDQGDIHLRHEDDDPEAEDIRMVLAEARFVGHHVLLPEFALEYIVAKQREDAILRWGKGLLGLLGDPAQLQ
jgi:hypothetical protein